MDRGAWWITVHEVTKSWTQLSTHACILQYKKETEADNFDIKRKKSLMCVAALYFVEVTCGSWVGMTAALSKLNRPWASFLSSSCPAWLPAVPPLERGTGGQNWEFFFGCDATESKMNLVSLLRPHSIGGFRTSSICCLTGHKPYVTGAQVHNRHVRNEGRTSLMVRWLILHAPSAGSLGSIPGQGTRFHVP